MPGGVRAGWSFVHQQHACEFNTHLFFLLPKCYSTCSLKNLLFKANVAKFSGDLVGLFFCRKQEVWNGVKLSKNVDRGKFLK